ncbi:MAG: glutamyl-tRNA reductase [bacterium]|jgi:glutamyl-tRNA reductase|nr:glutamyl-tRNA reductase [bacterium]
MPIVVTGLSHRTAPVAIRDGVAVLPKAVESVLHALQKIPSVDECALLSTCNRTEIYLVTSKIDEAVSRVWETVAQKSGISSDELRAHLFGYTDEEALRHLFEVASGLDSMVMGEPQIAGQVKDAGAFALASGSSKTVLNRLFRAATEASKRARTETEIGTGAVSVSFAAVELAKKILGNLEDQRALVLGAGEMSELTALYLVENGVKTLTVASRTLARAEDLAQRIRGRAVAWDAAMANLDQVDVVISSTSAEVYVLDRDAVAAAMYKRKNRSMFLIDIAMPRDIDPEAGKLYNVFLYDLDDLESVVGANLDKRKIEAEKVRVILDQEVQAFIAWTHSLDVVPTIVALRQHFQAFLDLEMDHARLDDLTEEQRNEIAYLLRRFMNKLLHKPVTRLKEAAEAEDGIAYANALSFLFELTPGQVPGEQEREEVKS